MQVFPVYRFTICKKNKNGLNHHDYRLLFAQTTKNLIIEGVMFNHDTPWKNIFCFIQRCCGNQELDIFEKFCKKSEVFVAFGLE